MQPTVVVGTVSQTQGEYPDKSPRVEIRVPVSRAQGLPYRPGEHVPVVMKFGTLWYRGALHASSRMKVVYFSPDLTRRREKSKLGKVLKALGVGLNEQLQLHVKGNQIWVRDRWGNGLGTVGAAINRAIGDVPRSIEEIASAAGMQGPAPVYIHLKYLRDNGYVTRTPDCRYAAADPGGAPRSVPVKTIAQRILAAVFRFVAGDPTAHFTLGDIRDRLKMSPALWRNSSYNSLFHAMRADRPGRAPNVAAEYMGVFRRLGPSAYCLTERGQALLKSGAAWRRIAASNPSPGPGGGAGFGSAENNKQVEEAARQAVMEEYRKGRWAITPVDHLKRGHDLECRKGKLAHNVEVKGVSGSKQSFPITEGEVRAAKRDPNWVLCVVTSALDPRTRKVWTYTRDDFLVCFDRTPIAYMAKLTR